MMLQSSPADPLLKVENLVVEYVVNGKIVHAVSDVSLDVARGETLGLVGEVRLRQVHARPRRAAVAPGGIGQGAVRRQQPDRNVW